MADDAHSTGTILEIRGVVIDARFPDGELPGIYNALEIDRGDDAAPLIAEVQQHLGDDRVRAVAFDTTDGLARGTEVRDTGGPISVPVGEATLGRIFNVLGDTIDEGGDVGDDRSLADPPRGPGLRPAQPHRGDPRDRHQGRQPPRALRPGREGRPLRRRRRRQDGADPGADPQHRPGARRPVGVRRRGRAHPRGQRPLARDEGERRPREDGARLRPDERAAGRPAAGRPQRPDDGRVLPRRGRPGRAALHRQHLPLRAGGLRGLGAPRPHALGRGLPADPAERDGRPAGAHHLDAQRARSPRCRRSTCPPTTSPTRRRPPASPTSTRRRCSRAASRRRASTRPSTRSTPPAASSPRRASAPSTTRSPRRCRRSCRPTAISRTSSRSSAWTS